MVKPKDLSRDERKALAKVPGVELVVEGKLVKLEERKPKETYWCQELCSCGKQCAGEKGHPTEHRCWTCSGGGVIKKETDEDE